MTGTLVALGADTVTLAVGPMEYELMVPEVVRRQLQLRIGETISLRTYQYMEGNVQQGRFYPRIIGFLHPAELEFFDAICSVDGVGVKKALRAMVRPVRDVATAIEEQNVKELSALPGIGPALAERIVAKLRRKMARFALMIAQDLPEMANSPQQSLVNECYEALLAIGHSPVDARAMLEKVTTGKKQYKSVEDLFAELYQQSRP